LTNAWFVSWGVGSTALAAVNVVAPVLLALGAVSTTVGVGGASLVSRALGAGKPEVAARAAGNAFVVFWIAAALITVLGLAFLDPLLSLLGAHGELREPARQYAQILIAGSVLSTGFSALVRAEGRMRFATLIWVIPVLVHIALDPMLIFGFNLGVVGAGLGTVGGQAVSAGMCVWFFFVQKDRPYRVSLSDLKPDGPTMQQVVSIGAPSFLSGFGATMMAVLVNSLLVAGGGAVALAAHAVVSRIQTFLVMPQTGISQGMAPIVGFNWGLGRLDRVRSAFRLSVAAVLSLSVAGAGLVALLSSLVISVFLPPGSEYETAKQALLIVCVGTVFSGFVPVISTYFQSVGKASPAYLLSVGTLLLVKIPLVWLASGHGPYGVWWAVAVGEATAALVALAVLFTLREKRK